VRRPSRPRCRHTIGGHRQSGSASIAACHSGAACSAAAPDVNIACPYETLGVDHGVAVITTIKGILLVGVTTIFPDLTCDVFDHDTTLPSYSRGGALVVARQLALSPVRLFA
jgi:hypothetical protein